PIRSSGRSFVTSYAISIAISFTSCLKSRVVVSLSRRIVSLCWIRGWSSTVRLGNRGCGMGRKVRLAIPRRHGCLGGYGKAFRFLDHALTLASHRSPSPQESRDVPAVLTARRGRRPGWGQPPLREHRSGTTLR